MVGLPFGLVFRCRVRQSFNRSNSYRRTGLLRLFQQRIPTRKRHLANCTKADPAYGEGVRKAIEALAAGKL
jgi:hypothetical protein